MASRIGRYLLFEEFARGGMATVHLGRLDGSVGFKRVVAIKRINPETAGDAGDRSSIQDEALITSRIIHRNVVQLFDVVETDGNLFLIMEYVHGLSLSALIKEARARAQPIPVRVAAAVVADALEGLQAAHDATDADGKLLEIVHRDMSPQNVLVGADGVARVLDFGIAWARIRSHLTSPGLLKGKLAYMAPEQLHGNATRASDIFSTGLILYEAVSGVRAVGDFETDGEAMAAILLGKIVPLHALRSELPAALTEIVERALARQVAGRFGSAHLMAQALRAWGVASAHDVARWVASLAGDTLAERQKAVRQVESFVESSHSEATQTVRIFAPRQQRRASLLAVFVGGLVLSGGVAAGLLAQRHPAPVEVHNAVPVDGAEGLATPGPVAADGGVALAAVAGDRSSIGVPMRNRTPPSPGRDPRTSVQLLTARASVPGPTRPRTASRCSESTRTGTSSSNPSVSDQGVTEARQAARS